MKKWLPFALFACPLACTTTQPTTEIKSTQFGDVSEDSIIGGELDNGDPAIVALYGREPGADKGALCTAEIVSPTVVLTAAHCVHPDLIPGGANAEFFVLLANDLTDKDNPSPRLAVKETHYNPAFDPKNILAGNDIAVVILEEPTNIKPLKINRKPITADMDGDAVRIVGYGLNKGYPQKGAGIKRTANVKLNSHTNNMVKTGGWKARICQGDSGGPVLMNIDGEEQIIGVNSFGFIFCLGSGNSTRVDAYPEFLDTYLR